MVRTASDYWWVWLVTGTVWLIISIIILQFDRSSAMTIGVIAAVVFMGGSIQSFAIARKVEGASWLWHVFGMLLVVGSVTSFLYPGKTFAIMSAIIGAIFVLTGIFWVMKAFAVRGSDDIWWLGAAAGVIVFCHGRLAWGSVHHGSSGDAERLHWGLGSSQGSLRPCQGAPDEKVA